MSEQTETKTLIEAARVLARDIQSDDGVANAALAEIADRMEELETRLAHSKRLLADVSPKLRELEKDRERLDWLERNLLHLDHNRGTNSVDMGGINVRGQLLNEARGANAGSCYFSIKHKTIRAGIDAAMEETK